MTNATRLITMTSALAIVAMLDACVGWGDMFAPEHELVGPYTLFETESGRFKLGGPGKPAGDAGGYVDGSIDSLGWSATHLVAWRGQPLFGGDDRGWMVVDIASGRVTGPISPETRLRDSALARIQVRSADAVWRGRSH